MREHHPDLNPGSRDAAVRTQQINEAYAVLRDPVRRASFDRRHSATLTRSNAERAGRPTDASDRSTGGTEVHVDADFESGDGWPYAQSGWTVAIGIDFTEPAARMLAGLRSARRRTGESSRDEPPRQPHTQPLDGLRRVLRDKRSRAPRSTTAPHQVRRSPSGLRDGQRSRVTGAVDALFIWCRQRLAGARGPSAATLAPHRPGLHCALLVSRSSSPRENRACTACRR